MGSTGRYRPARSDQYRVNTPSKKVTSKTKKQESKRGKKGSFEEQEEGHSARVRVRARELSVYCEQQQLASVNTEKCLHPDDWLKRGIPHAAVALSVVLSIRITTQQDRRNFPSFSETKISSTKFRDLKSNLFFRFKWKCKHAECTRTTHKAQQCCGGRACAPKSLSHKHVTAGRPCIKTVAISHRVVCAPALSRADKRNPCSMLQSRPFSKSLRFDKAQWYMTNCDHPAKYERRAKIDDSRIEIPNKFLHKLKAPAQGYSVKTTIDCGRGGAQFGISQQNLSRSFGIKNQSPPLPGLTFPFPRRAITRRLTGLLPSGFYT
ncbi:hypothetical protein J6590_079770 [Homalodisca vitripennis]|nr:hypothetical protein J6590_079770 [Homalodisca vitripennis]